MTDLQRRQKIAAGLVADVRTQQGQMLPEKDSLALALELAWTALAMKPKHQQAGAHVAKRFASRMGLNADDVIAYAEHCIQERMEAHDDDQ